MVDGVRGYSRVTSAAASGAANSSTCQGRAEPARSASATASASSGRGGLQQSRRSRSGWSRFSTGTSCCCASGCHDLARRGEPRRRCRVALGPHPGRGRAGHAGTSDRRELGLGQGQGLLHGGEPQVDPPARALAREGPQGGEIGGGPGQRGSGGDDGRVGEHPSGGDVPAARLLVAGLPERADDREVAGAADRVQPGGPAPGVDTGRRGRSQPDGLELLAGPLVLPGGDEPLREHVTHLDQHLDVQGGVAQPLRRQGPGGPVDRRVLLRQAQAEDVGHDGGQADPRHPEQPGRELGVEDGVRTHRLLRETGQVLRGGVQHPLGTAERCADGAEVGQGDRVDQGRAGARPPQLDEVRALAVAVAGGPFRVDGDRSGPAGERTDGLVESLRGDDDRRDAVGRLGERADRDLGASVGLGGVLGRGHGSRLGPGCPAPAATLRDQESSSLRMT